MNRRQVVLTILGGASLAACHHGQDISFTERVVYARDEEVKIAGKWQMSMDSPHGEVQGDLEVKQEGSKVNGTYTVEHMGVLTISGKVDGNKVSLTVVVPGADVTLAFAGTVDGDKMSGTTELGGNWKAARK